MTGTNTFVSSNNRRILDTLRICTGNNGYFTNLTGINTWLSTITGGTGYFLNTLNLTNTTNSSSTGTGALIVAGGAGFNGNIYASGNLVSTAGNIYGWTHYGGNISSNPWYISSNGSDMFINATNIYLRCNASTEFITLGDTGGFHIYLYLPTFCESTFSGTTGYFNNLLTSAGGISGTTSYNSGTGWFAGGLTGNAGYFTSLTGTNSYLSVITGNTGYFTSLTGTNGYFTSLTGTTTYMTSNL